MESALFQRVGVPVQQNVLLATREEARLVTCGSIELVRCGRCGLVRNDAFDDSLVHYDPRYDAAQEASPAFVAYLDRLIDRMIADGVRGRRVVEVGCGRGFFLERLCARGDNQGIGFDGAYGGPPTSADGRTRFVRSFAADVSDADIVVCRHVVEHVAPPTGFLRTALHNFRGEAVYLETPAWEWIVDNDVVWDVFYEHCNYFSTTALTNSLALSGFAAARIERVFDAQYHFARAQRRAGGDDVVREEDASVVEAGRSFGRQAAAAVERWTRVVECLAADGGVALWGAGAKGVTCANLVDADATRIAGVVDVNPRKQGRFVPRTGHRVLAASELAGKVRHVVVMNPSYAGEIAAQLAELGIEARLHFDLEGRQ